MTTEELFERHRIVALDSNVVIYLLEGSGTLADASAALIDGIESGAASGVLASVALTEVLTRPASLGEADLFVRQADELRSIANLRVVPLDTEAAIDAAWGRSGEHDLGDAIHVATARRSGATCFITNDARIRGRAGVDVVRLADIEVPEPLADAGQVDGVEPADDSERSGDAEPSVH